MLNWNQIINKEYDFQKRQTKIDALDEITAEEVSNMYLDVFFRKTKRVNLKMYSHAVYNEEAKIAERKNNIEKNQKFYKIMESYFNVKFEYEEIVFEDIASFQKGLESLPRKRELEPKIHPAKSYQHMFERAEALYDIKQHNAQVRE